MEQKLTGYPSIDRPWMKYYSEEARNATLPECTIYEYLYEKNKMHLDDVAMVYVGRNITYRELFGNINKTAVAFSEEGIGPDDIVTIIAPSIPEIIYSFYALNKLGAVSNFIDPRKSLGEVEEALSVMKTKACIVLDDMWEKFYEVLNKHASLLISVTIADSLPVIPKTLVWLKRKMKRHQEIISWKELRAKYVNSPKEVISYYQPNKMALLEYTGGTTGVSKAVMLSNENVNSVVEQTVYSGVPIKRGESWLAIAFPFTAYSIICSQHMPLSLGVKAYLCFDLDVKKIEKQLKKTRANHMANTPIVWEQLTNSKSAKNMNFGFIIAPTVGADSLNIQKEREINTFLENHNCKYKLLKGYGMTEVGSGVCITPNNEVNKLGSVGIPFNLTCVSIFDLETGEELPYGEQGEICMTGPSVMLGYYNNDKASQEVLRRHSDGQTWMHSGDLGHMDEDGFLYIDGRIKRMVINHMGFKIFAPVVEEVVCTVSEVEKCCVVGINDTVHNAGQVPVVFVIPRENANRYELRKDIMACCERQLPTYSYPQKIVFIEEFPYTSAAKVDYRKLEKEAEEIK